MTNREEKPGRVSIIIPCYNAEEYVGEAIESALSQTYEQTKVTVVDDGSTDGSLNVIRSFGDRIRWRTGANQGAPAARNWGLRLASGEFVKFLDADDVLVRDVVERQVAQMQSLGERTIVYSDVGIMNENGENRRVRSHQPRKETEEAIAYFLQNDIQTPCPLHRRRLLNEINGFDERLFRGQESDLHLRLHLSGVHFHYVSHVGVYYRQHDGPDRIKNQSYAVTHPESGLKRVRIRREAIERSVAGPIPQAVSDILARQTWLGGRKVLQAGHLEESRKYFETARSWSPNRSVVGHPLYRVGVHILGPVIAEQFRNLRPQNVLRRLGLSDNGRADTLKNAADQDR